MLAMKGTKRAMNVNVKVIVFLVTIPNSRGLPVRLVRHLHSHCKSQYRSHTPLQAWKASGEE